MTYDEEDLGGSVAVRSVKDFDSIVAELRVCTGLLRPNVAKRHRSARVRYRETDRNKERLVWIGFAVYSFSDF